MRSGLSGSRGLPNACSRITGRFASSFLLASAEALVKSVNLYVHAPRDSATRHIDDSTEEFVDATKMGVAQ
jgi:hypothetical protein